MNAKMGAFLLALSVSACGGNKESKLPPVQKQTSAQEILRLGNVWTSVMPDKGILSPPSKISLFRTHRKSEIRMSETRFVENLTIEEEVQLREGPLIKCVTRLEHDVGHRWGRKNGEAAVEIVRPALSAPRSCDGVHPEGPLAEPAKRALFVLRSDNLVAVEPVTDQRRYIPGSL